MRNCRLEKFYGKLANRTRVVGSSISTSDPMIAEALGYSGLDFLWIDMEHTPLEKAQILYQLMAVQSTGIPAFVRVPWNDFILVKPILDMGPDGIIFPNVKITPNKNQNNEVPIRASLFLVARYAVSKLTKPHKT